MAEPLYPSVEDQGEKRPLGFDVVAEPSGEPKSYTVEFTSSEKGTADDQRAPEASGGSEEIKLLERKSSSPEEKVNDDLSIAALCLVNYKLCFCFASANFAITSGTSQLSRRSPPTVVLARELEDPNLCGRHHPQMSPIRSQKWGMSTA